MHCAFAAVLLLVGGAAYGAGDGPGTPPTLKLGLHDALKLAVDRAPAPLLARKRVDVARGRLLGVDPWLADNPRASLASGARLKSTGPTIDLDAALSQAFELGGQQGARRDAARASVLQGEALADDVARRSLAEVGEAFINLQAADARARVATQYLERARGLLNIASKRASAGEASAIDAQLAISQAARASADVSSGDADREAAATELKKLLGLERDVVVVVDAEASSPASIAVAVAGGATATTQERADLRALRADRDRAAAEAREADGAAWPTVEGQAGYSLDDGDNIVSAGVSVPIPLFQRGQGAAASARGETAALDVEIAALARSAEAERAGAAAVLVKRTAAVTAFRDAVDAARKSAELARRSYNAGESSLGELLVVEREALLVEHEEIELRMNEERAALAVVVATGVVP